VEKAGDDSASSQRMKGGGRRHRKTGRVEQRGAWKTGALSWRLAVTMIGARSRARWKKPASSVPARYGCDISAANIRVAAAAVL